MSFHCETIYEDTGCELAPSCLNCPFPICIKYEGRANGIELQGYKRHLSDLQKVERISGIPTKEAARVLNVTVRTVFRILQRVKTYQKVGG